MFVVVTINSLAFKVAGQNRGDLNVLQELDTRWSLGKVLLKQELREGYVQVKA